MRPPPLQLGGVIFSDDFSEVFDGVVEVDDLRGLREAVLSHFLQPVLNPDPEDRAERRLSGALRDEDLQRRLRLRKRNVKKAALCAGLAAHHLEGLGALALLAGKVGHTAELVHDRLWLKPLPIFFLKIFVSHLPATFAAKDEFPGRL